MHEPEGARPRARSPFAAAFLSLIFPGLGQLYAGAPLRALAFAAGPILLLALAAGTILRVDRIALLGFLIDPTVLDAVFVVNLAILVYRLVAIVDAYRVAEFLNAADASGDGRAGRARIGRNPLSIAGLIAIVLVMAGSHVVVARYDMLAQGFLDNGCIFISDPDKECALDATPSPGQAATPTPSDDEGTAAGPTDSPVPEETPAGSALPQVSIPPWDGKERLNILLIGADQRPGEGTFNTDTLIVVSIDPVSKQVAMFSLPRDTEGVPIPPGPARNVFGSVYSGKINAWWTNIHRRTDLFPGSVKNGTVGYNGLKAIMGYLYGLDIKYFVEVNFDGFQKVVDTMGGVTVNVQVPVSDDRFPSINGGLRRVYIPTGIQHMNGAEALRYARSRHGSNDFDRGARQQRVLLSMREQADPAVADPEAAPAHRRDRLGRLDRHPARPDRAAARARVADRHQEHPLVRLRAAAVRDREPPPARPSTRSRPRCRRSGPRSATRSRPTRPTRRSARTWRPREPRCGCSTGRATRVAGPRSRTISTTTAWPRPHRARDRPGPVPADTTIVVYNGAEANMPDTIDYLQKTFGVTVTTKTDPAMAADVVITIGKGTPVLEAPAGPGP